MGGEPVQGIFVVSLDIHGNFSVNVKKVLCAVKAFGLVFQSTPEQIKHSISPKIQYAYE